MPNSMNGRVQTAGQEMPNEVDCAREADGGNSESIQYECRYQKSTDSPEKNISKHGGKVGMDVKNELNADVKRDIGAEESVHGSKRMVIENLPASRIHGKFSLNLPYVF